MDYLRSCYRASMRPYGDRPDIVIPGRWRFCPEDADVVPYAHPFGSHIWEADDPPPFAPEVGEAEGPYPYSAGEVQPSAGGELLCGTREDWEGTAPYDPARVGAGQTHPEGLPNCCLGLPPEPPPPPIPTGGLFWPCGFEPGYPLAPLRLRVTFHGGDGSMEGASADLDWHIPEQPGFEYYGTIDLPCGDAIGIGILWAEVTPDIPQIWVLHPAYNPYGASPYEPRVCDPFYATFTWNPGHDSFGDCGEQPGIWAEVIGIP